MPITLTTPETRPSATIAKLIALDANAEQRVAIARYDVGYLDSGVFVLTRSKIITFNDAAPLHGDFTFAQLVRDVPEVRDLRNALENYAVTLGVFPGTVS